jgi:2-dehydropantoate 2-reductase
MRYIILGAGGIGCAIGARLQLARISVTFIARGAHLRALQTGGLRLRTPTEDRTLSVHAVGSPAEANITPEDTVFVTVKS